MKEEDYEYKIWENSGAPISKTDLWRKVKGDKKTCFDKINEMIQTSQLTAKTDGNKIMIKRLDSLKKFEWEFGFEFQRRMLLTSRDVIKKSKYPMFKRIGTYKTSRFVHLGAHSKTVTDTDKKGEYKPRTKVVQTNFDNMSFYYTALFLFISRINLQRALGLLTKPEADRRIKKCENALDYHFKKLLSENPRESKAIRQFFKHKIYGMDNFRI